MGELFMFRLPDGSFIKASASSGLVNACKGDGRSWKSADLLQVFPDGHEIILCSVEFETGKGLVAAIWDEESGTPFFKQVLRPDSGVHNA